MVSLTNRIAALDEEIANETAKLQGNTQGEREEIQRRLQAAQTERDAATQELLGIADERQMAQIQHNQDAFQGKQSEEDINRARQDIEAATANIQQCQRRGGDDLSLFCRNLPVVYNTIKNEQWAGEVPVGPFGQFVSVKDSKWAPLMRTQLGQSMGSFAVTDNRDRYKLQQILLRTEKYVAHMPTLICSRSSPRLAGTPTSSFQTSTSLTTAEVGPD